MMDQYEVYGVIGEGAHGIVLKATHIESGDIVALKKTTLKSIANGLPVQTLREIKSLQQLAGHPHIVKLRDVFSHCLGFVFAFDYMPTDLGRLIKSPLLSVPNGKSYIKQLLRGVGYIHSMNLIHRDLKPANLLISEKGILKIADFSLCRVHLRDKPGKASQPYSHEVATRWYRAPELLFGARHYTEAVDLWSVGCIIAEIMTKEAIFQGESDIDQIACVLKVLGSPTEINWPDYQNLPDAGKISFPHFEGTPLVKLLPGVPSTGVDLVRGFLNYNSMERISAARALDHKYLKTPPLPTSASQLPHPVLEGATSRASTSLSSHISSTQSN